MSRQTCGIGCGYAPPPPPLGLPVQSSSVVAGPTPVPTASIHLFDRAKFALLSSEVLHLTAVEGLVLHAPDKCHAAFCLALSACVLHESIQSRVA